MVGCVKCGGVGVGMFLDAFFCNFFEYFWRSWVRGGRWGVGMDGYGCFWIHF